AGEARGLADRATAVRKAVQAIGGRMRTAEEALGARELEMKEAEDAARQAAEALAGAEEEWGTAANLAALRVKAERLDDLGAQVARSLKEQQEIGMQIEALDAGAGNAASALDAAKTAAGAADRALVAARAEVERVAHA